MRKIRNVSKLFAVSILFIVMILLVSSADDKFYKLQLYYANGTLNFISVDVKPGLAPDNLAQPDTGYKLEVLSFSNSKLISFNFNIPLILLSDEIDPNTGQIIPEKIQLTEMEVILGIPYFRNGKTIEIYNPNNKKVLSIVISQFAQMCGNSICDENENNNNCPQDCGKKEIGTQWLLPLTVFGILVLAILLALSKFKKKTE